MYLDARDTPVTVSNVQVTTTGINFVGPDAGAIANPKNLTYILWCG